ncbi:MAG: efflux transporter outer membrane subunit [Pseudomonadales bacterium]|nr:efflux transporter outer membrane subunit [Pseudomonadales bacterium]
MRRLLLLPAMLLAACQSSPLVAPEVAVPQQWPHRAGATAAAEASSLADQPWAQVFPVPELNALVDEALAGSSDLLIAVERVELARAQYGLERSVLFPAVDVGGSATRQRTPGAKPDRNSISESSSLSLGVSAWEIDLWGKLAARTEAARRDVLANEALVEAVRISLVAQVSSLYLDLLDLDNQLGITRRTLEGRQKSLQITRARFREGISSILDVRQVESLVASSERALAEQQRRSAQAENALSVLLGRNPGPIARSARLDALALPPGVMAGLPSELLERRPDIRAAEESLRGADANIEAARKAFLPNLALTGAVGYASPELGDLLDSGRYAWSLQPALALPLFNAGRLRAGVEQAQAQQRILVEQYKATIRQAFREVSDALVAFEQLGLQLEASRRVEAANRERLRLTKARYLAGITGYFEVLDAERQLFDSELEVSAVTRATHQSVVQLYRALGGGWRAQ